MRLVSVLHDLLVCDTTNKEKRDELQRYVYFVPNQTYTKGGVIDVAT